jgi:hypothetical protein
MASIIGAASAAATDGADITCSTHPDTVVGDTLIAIESTDWGFATDTEMAPPGAGWMELGEWHHAGGASANGIHVRLWGIASPDSGSDNYVFNQGIGSDGIATIVTVRDIDLAAFLISGSFAASGTPTREAPSISSVPPGSVLLCGAMLDPGVAMTWDPPPTGMTELADIQSTVWTTTTVAGLENSPNPSGTRTFTAPSGQTGAGVVWSLVLPPLAVAVDTTRFFLAG